MQVENAHRAHRQNKTGWSDKEEKKKSHLTQRSMKRNSDLFFLHCSVRLSANAKLAGDVKTFVWKKPEISR